MNGDTPITMSVKAAIAGGATIVVAAAVALWAVLTFTLGNVADDVSDIRDRLTTTQVESRAVETRGLEADTDIRRALSNIDKNVALMANDMASYSKSLGGIQAELVSINDSVKKLFGLYEGMNVRLVRIEEKVTITGETLEKLAPLPQPQ